MNEELTNEVLEVMKKCSHNCPTCDAYEVCDKYDWRDTIQLLAGDLLEERAKPKGWDGVIDWDSRPWANEVVIAYRSKEMPGDKIGDKIITIKRPKTRIDEIADEVWHEINKGVTGLPIDIIKRGLKKYAEERSWPLSPRKEKQET